MKIKNLLKAGFFYKLSLSEIEKKEDDFILNLGKIEKNPIYPEDDRFFLKPNKKNENYLRENTPAVNQIKWNKINSNTLLR